MVQTFVRPRTHLTEACVIARNMASTIIEASIHELLSPA
jgi:hypothetical protein